MVEGIEATAGLAEDTAANPTENPSETQAIDQMENLNASEQEATALSTEQSADNRRLSESEAEFESESESKSESRQDISVQVSVSTLDTPRRNKNENEFNIPVIYHMCTVQAVLYSI